MDNKLILQQGQTYSLKVTAITKRNKQIRKKDNLVYNIFDIMLESKNGETTKAEWVTTKETPDAFGLNVYQYIRCGFISNMGTPEIEPADEPSAGLQQRYMPQSAALDSVQGKEPQEINTYTIPMSGRSYAFALGYAKDILCAEIGQQSFPHEVKDEDIDRMIAWADKINAAIADRVTF